MNRRCLSRTHYYWTDEEAAMNDSIYDALFSLRNLSSHMGKIAIATVNFRGGCQSNHKFRNEMDEYGWLKLDVKSTYVKHRCTTRSELDLRDEVEFIASKYVNAVGGKAIVFISFAPETSKRSASFDCQPKEKKRRTKSIALSDEEEEENSFISLSDETEEEEEEVSDGPRLRSSTIEERDDPNEVQEGSFIAVRPYEIDVHPFWLAYVHRICEDEEMPIVVRWMTPKDEFGYGLLAQNGFTFRLEKRNDLQGIPRDCIIMNNVPCTTKSYLDIFEKFRLVITPRMAEELTQLAENDHYVGK